MNDQAILELARKIVDVSPDLPGGRSQRLARIQVLIQEAQPKKHKRWAVISLRDFSAPRAGYAYLYNEKPEDTQVSGIGLTAMACIEIEFEEGQGLTAPVDPRAMEGMTSWLKEKEIRK